MVPGGTTTADEPVEPPVEEPIDEPVDDRSTDPTVEPDEVPLVGVGAPPVPPGPQVAVSAPPVPSGASPAFGARRTVAVARASQSIDRRDADDVEAAARTVAAQIAALIARFVR